MFVSPKQHYEESLDNLKKAIVTLHMTYHNAMYEAERLDRHIHYTANCDMCSCKFFTSSMRSSVYCSCGHTLDHHKKSIADEIRIMPQKNFYTPAANPKMITLVIHSHGCDLPIPLLKYEPKDAAHIIPRTRIMSSVPHGCISYYPHNVLSFIQHQFMDPSIDPMTSMTEFSKHISQDVAHRQSDVSLLNIQAGDEPLRDAFMKLPLKHLYFIHTPIGDRLYNFVKTQNDLAEKKDEFGVFMVHSTYHDDNITINFMRNMPLLENTNLISDQLNPSLFKYITPIFGLEHDYKKTIHLRNLLKSVFTARPDLDIVNIIDLGCRVTCSPLPFHPQHVDRIYSRDYIAELPIDPAATAMSVGDATAAADSAAGAANSAAGAGSPASMSPKADTQGKRKRRKRPLLKKVASKIRVKSGFKNKSKKWLQK
jgi:hypothetical protein